MFKYNKSDKPFSYNTKSNELGFTLAELMIVIAIIGILAVVAYPSYQNSVKKTKRGDVKAELTSIAQNIEKMKVGYKRYDAIPLAKIGFDNTGVQKFPATKSVYKLTINKTASNTVDRTWEIKAEPLGSSPVKGDGKLAVNYLGWKCWDSNNNNVDEDCTLSATSDWKD